MGWGDCKAGAGNYINLKEDGESVTVTVVGEPVVKTVTDKSGNTRKRVFLAAATGELLKKGKLGILPLNITTAEALAKLLKANDPKASLVGKVSVKLTRHGAKGDMGTKYELTLAGKLSPAEVKRLASLELPDLDVDDKGIAEAGEKAPF
jgi:antitoxin (DNA-binding transcriptional repressor) of toxin-antitoxin stability system